MVRLDMLLEFVKNRPDDPFPRYGLAMEYKNLRRLEDASRTFTELLSRHPEYTAAYLHAGNTLLELGQREQARAVYETGIAACARKGDQHARGELESALANLE
jgi:tetratricopeptide (TPR) repeat protein